LTGVFPVMDDIPNDRHPLVTYALLVASLAVLVLLGAGVGAIAGVVLFLWWFGPSVEDALGRPRFLVFALAGAAIAAGVQALADPSPAVAVAAASGGVAAIMGAYLRLYPTARVFTLMLWPLFSTFVAIPIVVLLAGWIALQVALALIDPGSVAWAGQLAGFAAGALTAGLLATHVKTPESLLRRGRAAWQ
jgi:membrane associated rhomboid family serine protease